MLKSLQKILYLPRKGWNAMLIKMLKIVKNVIYLLYSLE